MQEPSWRKQSTFFLLYIAQSVPMSLISTLLPVLMRQQSFSLTSIGLLQFVKLPWILKLLWAPLVDRHSNSLVSYKRWIWASELCYALCILMVAFLRLETDFSLILLLVVLAFICSATQDIATDALTSRSFYRDTLQANKLQAMGQFAGSIIGGGLLMVAYRYLGWGLLFAMLACVVFVLVVPLQFYREPLSDRQGVDGELQQIGWGSILSFFSQPMAVKRSILLVLYNSGLVGSMAMMKPYLVDMGYTLGDIAWLFSLYGSSCGLLASFVAGRYLKHLPRHRSHLLISLCITLATAIIAVVAALGFSKLWFVMLLLAVLWLAYGAGTVMVYSFAMDFVRQGSEGTDFTLQTVLLHLSSLIIAGASGKLASIMGYNYFFVLELILALLSLAYVYYFFRWCDPRE